MLLHSLSFFLSFLQLSSLNDLPQSLSFIYDELSPWLVVRANQKKPAIRNFQQKLLPTPISGLLLECILPPFRSEPCPCSGQLCRGGTMSLIISASGRESACLRAPGALLAALRFLLIHHQSRFGFSAICPFVLVSSLLFHVSLFCLFFGGPLECPRSLAHTLLCCEYLLFTWDSRPIQPRSTSRDYQKRPSGPSIHFGIICCYHVFSRLLRIEWEPPQVDEKGERSAADEGTKVR